VRRILCLVLAAFMIAIGLAHFLAPAPFASIVPAWPCGWGATSRKSGG
jgi:uncharacterized membrane protein